VIITLLIFACSITACAQSFEGIIRYKIIYDYEDSVKQKKAQAQRALAERAETQEKVKLLKEQLMSI
jgi:hypothetical protein